MKVLKIVAALIGNTAYTMTSAGPVVLVAAWNGLQRVTNRFRRNANRTSTGGKAVITMSCKK